MQWLTGTWAVFRKDVRLELRNRYAVNTLLMFVAAALLWIVVLFSASIGLGRSFVSEEERGTVLLLQLNTQPSTVYAGKLLFNIVLVLGLNAVALGLFLVLLDVPLRAPGLLLTVVLLGALGLSGATTLLAAIIARTARRGPLLPVLLLPLLMPLLLSVVSATRKAILGTGWLAAQSELLTLIGFAGTTISASVLLFDYVWND